MKYFIYMHFYIDLSSYNKQIGNMKYRNVIVKITGFRGSLVFLTFAGLIPGGHIEL